MKHFNYRGAREASRHHYIWLRSQLCQGKKVCPPRAPENLATGATRAHGGHRFRRVVPHAWGSKVQCVGGRGVHYVFRRRVVRGLYSATSAGVRASSEYSRPWRLALPSTQPECHEYTSCGTRHRYAGFPASPATNPASQDWRSILGLVSANPLLLSGERPLRLAVEWGSPTC
jgi:hypothetical protein